MKTFPLKKKNLSKKRKEISQKLSPFIVKYRLVGTEIFFFFKKEDKMIRNRCAGEYFSHFSHKASFPLDDLAQRRVSKINTVFFF